MTANTDRPTPLPCPSWCTDGHTAQTFPELVMHYADRVEAEIEGLGQVHAAVSQPDFLRTPADRPAFWMRGDPQIRLSGADIEMRISSADQVAVAVRIYPGVADLIGKAAATIGLTAPTPQETT